MSSNKTIIPGMQDAYSDQQTYAGGSNATMQNGTYFPHPFGTTSVSALNRKPIVGFLYSISKTSAAEFWPVQIGSNTIGRSPDCDICLQEATVSDQHAVLVVRQMKNPEKIIASICDARSTCGTMINGESLGFDPRECFNADILTIGEHYDLYFILLDAKQIGLNVCTEFMPTEQPLMSGRMVNPPMNNPYMPPTNPGQGTKGFEPENAFSQSGTVGLNDPMGNKPGTKPGGTIFM